MLNQLHTLSRAVYYYTSNFYTGTAVEANKLKCTKRTMAYAMAIFIFFILGNFGRQFDQYYDFLICKKIRIDMYE